LYLILLLRDGAWAETYGRDKETPPPPYTGRSGGTRKSERTRSGRSHDLLRHRVAMSCDSIRAERGGGPTSVIGREMRTLGLLLPYAAT